MSTHVLCVCVCHRDARRCVERECVAIQQRPTQESCLLSRRACGCVCVTETRAGVSLRHAQVCQKRMCGHPNTHSLLTHLKKTHSLSTHLRASQWHTHTSNTCVHIEYTVCSVYTSNRDPHKRLTCCLDTIVGGCVCVCVCVCVTEMRAGMSKEKVILLCVAKKNVSLMYNCYKKWMCLL